MPLPFTKPDASPAIVLTVELLAGTLRVTDPPVQKVVGPPADTVGVVGGVLTVTTVAAEIAEVQPFAIVWTV